MLITISLNNIVLESETFAIIIFVHIVLYSIRSTKKKYIKLKYPPDSLQLTLAIAVNLNLMVGPNALNCTILSTERNKIASVDQPTFWLAQAAALRSTNFEAEKKRRIYLWRRKK